MKKCPNCQQLFTDDNMFCLEDGTSLLYVPETGQNPTVLPTSGETPTIFIPKQPTPVYSAPQVQPVSSGRWIFPVLGFLIGVIAVLGFLLIYPKLSPSNENKTAEIAGSKETNKQTPRPTETPAAPKQSQTLAPTPTPAPPSQPATVVSRMRFNRGEITHNETGRIGTNSQRVFLLRCRNGQSLSATVYSDNNCVSFDNNSSSVSYITTAGDNRIYLKNTCESTRFNVSVTIR
jgi:hypothetical protein